MSEKKVGKRLLTWVLVLVMTLSLLPLNVLAEESDGTGASTDTNVIYGHHDGNTWTPDTSLSDTIEKDDINVEGIDYVSKKAEYLADNKYQITLKVGMHETTDFTSPEVATVLVIDISNSMDKCLETGDWHHISHRNCKSRLDVAKDAAESFVNTYAGTVENSGRYLAIVLFNYNSHTHLRWTDVSTRAGKQTAINSIRNIDYGYEEDGGTNLEQGLALADSLLNTVPSENISDKNKNVIALTDGAPTRAGTDSNTSDGSADINTATANTATAVKTQANLYTVCFGAENEYTWKEYHDYGLWVSYWEYGPTVGEFLRSSIASGSKYAFNANNRSELNNAFSNISEEITTGLSSGTVRDTLPDGVTANGNFEGTWELEPDTAEVGGSGATKTYTYTKTYIVTIDPDNIDSDLLSNGYYPLNGETTLTVGDNDPINFPIPAGKVTFPEPEKYTYTLTYNANGGSGAPDKQEVKDTTETSNTFTVSNQEPTREGYKFLGWATSSSATEATIKAGDEVIATKDAPNKTIYAVWQQNKYTVTWKNWDGTVLKTDKGVEYGSTPKYDGSTPTRPASGRYTYTFDTWTPEIVAVTKDAVYTATYKSTYHRPSTPTKPTVEIPDDDALGLNTTDHFAYIVGYGNGEVRPQNNITRAEVATIFFRLLTDDVRDENLTKTNRYSDVAATSWYNTAVSTLSSMGIITGYPDGTFRPNAAITRAEFAAIAARFDNDGDKTAAKFSDIANHWAKDEISIAYNNGWITGYPNGTFGPQRDITRAETMTLVNRVLNRQPETEDDLLPNMTVWTDNANPKAWYYLAVQEATNSHYYEFKTNSQYEKWTELRETRDWSQLEK